MNDQEFKNGMEDLLAMFPAIRSPQDAAQMKDYMGMIQRILSKKGINGHYFKRITATLVTNWEKTTKPKPYHFIKIYERIRRDDTVGGTSQEPKEKCGECGGYGFHTVYLIAINMPYQAVTPCGRCNANQYVPKVREGLIEKFITKTEYDAIIDARPSHARIRPKRKRVTVIGTHNPKHINEHLKHVAAIAAHQHRDDRRDDEEWQS